MYFKHKLPNSYKDLPFGMKMCYTFRNLHHTHACWAELHHAQVSPSLELVKVHACTPAQAYKGRRGAPRHRVTRSPRLFIPAGRHCRNCCDSSWLAAGTCFAPAPREGRWRFSLPLPNLTPRTRRVLVHARGPESDWHALLAASSPGPASNLIIVELTDLSIVLISLMTLQCIHYVYSVIVYLLITNKT